MKTVPPTTEDLMQGLRMKPYSVKNKSFLFYEIYQVIFEDQPVFRYFFSRAEAYSTAAALNGAFALGWGAAINYAFKNNSINEKTSQNPR